ncbi:hypothetical protein NBRC116494_16580 [Aurantivibrio plasticivorans]
MKTFLLKLLSRVILSISYLLPIVVRFVMRPFANNRWDRQSCIVVIGTFHNPNWFHAHVAPLAKAQIGEVVLVTDDVVDSLDNLVYACPPKWLSKVISRAGAKFVWSVYVGYKYRPDLFMAYHIYPTAPIAVFCGALFNRPVCYQATSGSNEIEGGGWKADNRILNALSQPSHFVERLAERLVKHIDLIVVRGEGAKQYFLEKAKPTGQIIIQTGSVIVPSDRASYQERSCDIIYVGQLIERKRPQWIVDIARHLVTQCPKLSINIVGDGEMRQELEALSAEYKLTENLHFLGQRKDVESLLANAKVFLLTSRWEGVSIAMLEALGSGTVPVVSNVGDLKSAIKQGKTGYLLDGEAIEFVEPIAKLLSDIEHWNSLSSAGYDWAAQNVARDVVAGKWFRNLNRVIEQKSGSSYPGGKEASGG